MSTGKGRIPTSVGKVESGGVPKKGLGEYREMVKSGRVPKKYKSRRVPEMVESKRVPERWKSGRVPEKGGIQASTGEGSG